MLDTTNMSEHFFENAQLFGLVSHLKPIILTHKLNELLRIDLKRNFEIDWIQKKTTKSIAQEPSSQSLFSENTRDNSQELDEWDIFSVFNYTDMSTDVEFYLYSNTLNNKSFYIKKQKEINYFFLVKNGIYLDYIKNLFTILSSNTDIQFCKKYDINSCEWKEHLII